MGEHMRATSLSSAGSPRACATLRVMAHMMRSWNLYCRMEKTRTEKKSRICQTATTEPKGGNHDEEMKSNKRRRRDVRAKKQTQQRWVPSAPCRGREHGREMVWIIIGHKSKKTKEKNEKKQTKNKTEKQKSDSPECAGT